MRIAPNGAAKQRLSSTAVGWAVEKVKGKPYWRTQTRGSVATFAFQTSNRDMTVYICGLKANTSTGHEPSAGSTTPSPPITVDKKADWCRVPVMTEIGVVPEASYHNLSCVMAAGKDFRLTGIFADREVLKRECGTCTCTEVKQHTFRCIPELYSTLLVTTMVRANCTSSVSQAAKDALVGIKN